MRVYSFDFRILAFHGTHHIALHGTDGMGVDASTTALGQPFEFSKPEIF